MQRKKTEIDKDKESERRKTEDEERVYIVSK